MNVSMANRFDGLQEVAKKAGINLATLSPDSYLVFVNCNRDKVAMLVGPQLPGKKQTMAYVKLDKGRKMDLRVIREIPLVFDGKSMNYDRALELAVTRALSKKAHKTIEMAL